MAEQVFSEELKRQTQLAWDYIEKLRPLITYMKLVPVDEQEISEYEINCNQIVPPDYRHWLTTYGSGRIELIEGALEFPSVYELAGNADRSIGDYDDPANCWKRPYLGYSGAPITSALDSTIIDDAGCAPVILTGSYSNEVEKVLASSWPMYVISEIIKCATKLCEQCSEDLLDEQLIAARDLTQLRFEEIDKNLHCALERAKIHNKTVISDGDEPSDGLCPNGMGNMTRLLKDLKGSMEGEGAIASIKEKLTTLFNPDKKFLDAVANLEMHISLGYSTLGCSFLANKVDLGHEQALNELLKHERREVREIAQKGLLRINPSLAEEHADRTYEWLDCAENWLLLRKNETEALRCLKEAERLAEDYITWSCCSEFWHESLTNRAEACRCLQEAEQVTCKASNFLSLAGSWIKLGEEENGKRCLLQSEAKSQKSINVDTLVWGAERWFETFSDTESATRCLNKAEKLINHPGYWGSCARAWEKLGNEQEMKRCLKNEIEMSEEMFGSE